MATNLEYALMAGHAYRTSRNEINWIPYPQGWVPFFPVPDPTTAAIFPTISGFEAVSFKNGNEVVISYAGTDFGLNPDILADFNLVVGLWSEQLGHQIGVGPMQPTELAMSSREFSATGSLRRPFFVLKTAL
jgi:hypothetical protein